MSEEENIVSLNDTLEEKTHSVKDFFSTSSTGATDSAGSTGSAGSVLPVTQEAEDKDSKYEKVDTLLINLPEETRNALISVLQSLGTKKKSPADNILEKAREEEGEDDNMSNFKHVPKDFHGIDISGLCISSHRSSLGKTHINPFYDVVKLVENPDIPWEDRVQALRYAQRSHHVDRVPNIERAGIALISDDRQSFKERYFVCFNNIQGIKFDYEIVNACHRYIFYNFEKHSREERDIEYKILSAQYLLSQSPVQKDIDSTQEFLISIALNKNFPEQYRAESADILERVGYYQAKIIGMEVIRELGRADAMRETIYANAQNVHDKGVSESVIKMLQILKNTVTTTFTINDFHERLSELIKSHPNQDTILKSFQRIIIDTSRYIGLNMVEILLLIWGKIQSSPSKNEIEKRLLEELEDMYKTCSSGYVSRLLNSLSGFFPDLLSVSISFNSQLKNNILTKYNKLINNSPEEKRDSILAEMTEYKMYCQKPHLHSKSCRKPCIAEFLNIYKLVLKEEFINEFKEYMDEKEISKIYEETIKNYFNLHKQIKPKPITREFKIPYNPYDNE